MLDTHFFSRGITKHTNTISRPKKIITGVTILATQASHPPDMSQDHQSQPFAVDTSSFFMLVNRLLRCSKVTDMFLLGSGMYVQQESPMTCHRPPFEANTRSRAYWCCMSMFLEAIMYGVNAWKPCVVS